MRQTLSITEISGLNEYPMRARTVRTSHDLDAVFPTLEEDRGTGTTYYVDPTLGSSSNSGTSADEPFAAFSSLPTLSAGMNVLLKRGETFREQLTLTAGGTAANPIRIGTYGTGAKPIITGGDEVQGTTATWTDTGSNVWSRALTTKPQTVIFRKPQDSGWTYGTKNLLAMNVDSEGDWAWVSSVLYVWAPSNPAKYFGSIEAAQRDHAVYASTVDYLEFWNIVGRCTGTLTDPGDIWGFNVAHVTLNGCEGYYASGANNTQCFTNHGISTSILNGCNFGYTAGSVIGFATVTGTIEANDCELHHATYYGHAGATATLTRCWIHHVNMAFAVASTAINCIISDTNSYGVYYNSTGAITLTNCTFRTTGNECVYLNGASGGTVTMKNCILVRGGRVFNCVNGGYTGDYNCFWTTVAGGNVVGYGGTSYTVTTFGTYQGVVTPQDANSVAEDPLFAGTAMTQASDFGVLAASPCVDAGTSLVTTDYWGLSRSTSDIGAIEQGGVRVGRIQNMATGAVGSVLAIDDDGNLETDIWFDQGDPFIATLLTAYTVANEFGPIYEYVCRLCGQSWERKKMVDGRCQECQDEPWPVRRKM